MLGPPGPNAARAAVRSAGRRRVAGLGGTSALIALSCSLMIEPDALSGGSDRGGAGGASGADDATGAGTATGGACDESCTGTCVNGVCVGDTAGTGAGP